jgi:hypothetical protein
MSILFDQRKQEGIVTIYIDQKQNPYCLVNSSETDPQLRSYRLLFD